MYKSLTVTHTKEHQTQHLKVSSPLSLPLSLLFLGALLRNTAMAAEVSSLVRVMGGGGYKEEQHRTVGNEPSSHGEKSTALITRDLLGGSSVESQELDLDLQVPSGWEKRLDLQVCLLNSSFFIFLFSVCFQGK